jgi:hypothetical protein
MWLRVRPAAPGASRTPRLPTNVTFQQGWRCYGTLPVRPRRGFLDQRLRARAAASGANSLSDADPLRVLLGSAGSSCSSPARTSATCCWPAPARVRGGVRLALGPAGRLVRQLLTESVPRGRRGVRPRAGRFALRPR